MNAITKTQSSGLKKANAEESQESVGSIPMTIGRSAFGGILMGLANLVPGISGGTMLLAAGIYPKFVNAIAEVTTFRFRLHSLIVLCSVAVSALIGIVAFAGVLKELVVHHRWVMYSLFIGLTLGGIPLVYQLAKPVSKPVIIGACSSFLAMLGLAMLQSDSAAVPSESNFFMLTVAGLAGASAMILPGVSGGYLLLLLKQYVPILDGISQFKDALSDRDLSAAMEPALQVMLPVGIGVVVGIVAVSNLLKWLMKRYKPATLGVLIGLLLGSVIGLWPFQMAVEPIVGETVVKGRMVTEENKDEFEPMDWPTARFVPNTMQIAGSFGLVVLGMAITMGVAKIGAAAGDPSESTSGKKPKSM